MDVWDLTKLLGRRWYFAVPFLMVTVAGSVYLAEAIQPDYIVTSHLILSPAASDGSEQARAVLGTNPWNALGTTALAQSGKLNLEGEAVVNDMKSRGLSDSYTVTVDNMSPIITLEIVGKTQEQAVATNEALVSMFQTNVKELQKVQGAPDAALISTRRLPGDKIEQKTTKVKRAVIAVGAAGALLSCGLTVALDALLRRRRGGKGPLDDPLGPPMAKPVRVDRALTSPVPSSMPVQSTVPMLSSVLVTPPVSVPVESPTSPGTTATQPLSLPSRVFVTQPVEAPTSPVPAAPSISTRPGQPPEDSTIILPLSSVSRRRDAQR